MTEFNLSIFFFGCLGGLIPDILRVIRNRHKTHLPSYFKSGNFWIGVLLLMILGGITAWVLETETFKDALVYGFASPQILSQLTGSLSSNKIEKGIEKPKKLSLLGWWSM